MSDASTLDGIGDLEAAIGEFRKELPGWWFTVGHCSVSRDASCGPDRRYCDRQTLEAYDAGFHCDDADPHSALASSLRYVTAEALKAIAERNGL